MNDQNRWAESESDASESRFNRITPKPQPEKPPRHPDDEAPTAVRIEQPEPSRQSTPNKLSKKRFLPWFFLAIIIIGVFFTPARVTTLVLGVDRPPQGTWIGRSDTIILTSLPPVLPQMTMLSIPRDLWVSIPNHWDNRINTAHYFAELEVPGTGMDAARTTIEQDFGINVNYVLRLKFDGFIDVVDAMGGVTVDLPSDMSGLTAGKHVLNGKDALKFVRDRTGSDDFFRQARGQLFIKSAAKELLNPLKWPRIPVVIAAVFKAVETDLPIWLWPRVGYGLLFSAVKGFDTHTLDREFVTPWVTNEGAQVLLPNWELINPLVQDLFK